MNISQTLSGVCTSRYAQRHGKQRPANLTHKQWCSGSQPLAGVAIPAARKAVRPERPRNPPRQAAASCSRRRPGLRVQGLHPRPRPRAGGAAGTGLRPAARPAAARGAGDRTPPRQAAPPRWRSAHGGPIRRGRCQAQRPRGGIHGQGQLGSGGLGGTLS